LWIVQRGDSCSFVVWNIDFCFGYLLTPNVAKIARREKIAIALMEPEF